MKQSKSNKKCLFCEKEATTKEHLVPKWLHKHYDLKDKRMKLRNGSTLAYSQGILPACKNCNNVLLGKLEDKVKSGNASPQDYYNWALKIQFGLSYKDTYLLEDLKNKEKGFIQTKEVAHKDIEFSPLILNNVTNSKFSFYPNPLGSVFLTKIAKNTKEEFALIDIGYPYRALSIALPTGYILTVLFLDKGLTKKYIEQNKINIFSEYVTLLTNEGFTTNNVAQFITYTLLKLQCRIKIPNGYSKRKNGIKGLRIPKKVKTNYHLSKEVLIDIAIKCNLPRELGSLDYENQIKT